MILRICAAQSTKAKYESHLSVYYAAYYAARRGSRQCSMSIFTCHFNSNTLLSVRLAACMHQPSTAHSQQCD